MVTTLDRAFTGQKLRRLREERKMTQQEVADIVGVTSMAISQYESGERSPKDSVKIALAQHFETTVEDLFFTF